MFDSFKKTVNNVPHKVGILGALAGALLSLGTQKSGDKLLKTAGKTAAFAGAGFLLGDWIEKLLKKK
jgi:uncharacterized membrane protein YebE (DUF533 family)